MVILCLTHWKATFQLPKTTDRPHTFRNWWVWREKTNGNKTDNSKPLAWNTSVKRISILMTITDHHYICVFPTLHKIIARQTDGRTDKTVGRSFKQAHKKTSNHFSSQAKKIFDHSVTYKTYVGVSNNTKILIWNDLKLFLNVTAAIDLFFEMKPHFFWGMKLKSICDNCFSEGMNRWMDKDDYFVALLKITKQTRK